MNLIKILVLMLMVTLTGCKKDVDEILSYKTGEWNVTGISVSGTSTETWVFHDNGHMDMGSYIDAFEWVYDKSNNSVLLKKCDESNNCFVMEFFVKKSTRNEQEWILYEGKPYQYIYKLKRNK